MLCIAFWIPITLFRLQTLHACSRISKMNPCSSMSRWLSLVKMVSFKLITSKVAEHLLHCVAFHFHFVNWSVNANFALLAAAAAGAGLILQSAAINKSDYFTIIAQYRNIGKKFCYFLLISSHQSKVPNIAACRERVFWVFKQQIRCG